MHLSTVAFLLVSAQCLTFGDTQVAIDSLNWDMDNPSSEWYRGLCYCGLRQKDDIIEGTIVKDFLKYPWMVFLTAPAVNDRDNLVCTGAVISPTAILTAAHCGNAKTNYSRVVAGQYDPDAEQVDRHLFKVKEIINHPDYNKSYYKNDVSVWLLEEPITCGRDLMPICLPNENLETVGSIAIIAGYGKHSPNQTYDPDNIPAMVTLREGNARIIPKEDCNPGDLIDQTICMTGESPTMPCSGDSGGPLAHMKKDGLFFSIGVMSTGYDDCPPDSNFEYQSTFHHRSFIEQHVKDLSPTPPGWLEKRLKP